MKKTGKEEAELDISDIPPVTARNSKKEPDSIPDAVLKRLPGYFRCLRSLFNADIMRVSSEELAEHMGITASQLRQDMKCLGVGGQRGYGYSVKTLYTAVSSMLGVGSKFTAVMIGAGNLGKAVANSLILEQRGVWLKGIFDISPEAIGKTVGELTVRDVSELKAFCRENKIDIAVVCCSAGSADEILKEIEDTGIKGVWNFSQHEIKPSRSGVPTVNVCTGDSLMRLIYEMSGNKKK